MRLVPVLTGICLAGMASAVNMSRYNPAPEVEPAFKNYLQQLYNFTEIKSANETFYNFFLPPGVLGIRGTNYTGQDAIIKEKGALLNVTSNHYWSHFPNTTNVTAETSTTKTYMVIGIINNIFIGQPYNNCSAAYYKSSFTLAKNKDGTINLTPHSGNLIFYNDFVIDPPTVPTNIQCAQ